MEITTVRSPFIALKKRISTNANSQRDIKPKRGATKICSFVSHPVFRTSFEKPELSLYVIIFIEYRYNCLTCISFTCKNALFY